MLTPNLLNKIAPLVKVGTRQLQRRQNVQATPPLVKISPAEKCIHGIIMVVAWMAVPWTVCCTIKYYLGYDEKVNRQRMEPPVWTWW